MHFRSRGECCISSAVVWEIRIAEQEIETIQYVIAALLPFSKFAVSFYGTETTETYVNFPRVVGRLQLRSNAFVEFWGVLQHKSD